MRADRRVLVVVAVVLAVLTPALIAFIADDDGPTGGPPYDPRSTADDGTRAFVRVLEEIGVDVEVIAPGVDPGDRTTVVFVDLLGFDATRSLGDWVRAGNELVVLDPFSPLGRSTFPLAAPSPQGAIDLDPGPPEIELLDVPCDLPALGAIEELGPGPAEAVRPSSGDLGCLFTADGPLVTVHAAGDGTITTAGVRDLITNSSLARSDHAALAVGLVGDASRVAVLDTAAPGGGDRSLLDLLPTGVVLAIVQLLVVAVVEMARRSRRHGRVLPEEPGIIGSASAPIEAAARVRARAGDRGGAIDDLRRDLARALGHDDLADVPGHVVATLAREAGVGLDDARRAVAPPSVHDDATLVELATTLADLTTVATRSSLPEEIRT